MTEVPSPSPADRRVGWWLIACALAVLLTLVVGGITRLTHSGLSIAEWKPVVGVVPPLSDVQWEAEFARYRATPEYRRVNASMTIDGFRSIYWVEWIHRLLGRLVGLVFLLPFLVLWGRGDIARRLVPRLLGLFVLGGAQGALGWYMVKSGLVDDPHVSALRLTAHLGLAVAIYGALLWVGASLLAKHPGEASVGARRVACGLAAFVFLMILTGGLVAGTRAGFAFNTFPLMGGAVVPPGVLALAPWWRNFMENVATVQFTHRVMALLLCVAVPVAWWRLWREPLGSWGRAALRLLPAALALQVGLGIATLLLVVPIPLAAAHQFVALVVFTLAVLVAEATA